MMMSQIVKGYLSMKHQQFWARFFLVASILTAGIIFYFSAQKGVNSSSMSDSITMQIAKLFQPDLKALSSHDRHSYLELVSTLVRKNAHFCEFALLGFNLMGFMRFRDEKMPRTDCRLWAWGIATAYGAVDEIHQLFINERVAMVVDVLIDSAGGLMGTVAMSVFLLLLGRLLKRSLP